MESRYGVKVRHQKQTKPYNRGKLIKKELEDYMMSCAVI